MTSRNSYLLRKYGITEEQFDELLEKQDGRCPVCERTVQSVGRRFHVDHNHKTKEIRGLLCGNCNHRVVGRHTNSSLLRRAAEYLEKGHTGLYVPERRKRKSKKRKRSRKGR